MASGHARVAQLADPRRVRMFHHTKPAWSDVWLYNPRVAQQGEEGDFQSLYARSREANMRPYHRAKNDRQWTYNLDFRPDIGELYFSSAELLRAEHQAPERGAFIIVEPNIKASGSPNKQWGWARWEAFAVLAVRAGFRLHQVGPLATRLLPQAALLGTDTFRQGCAVLARAAAYVGGEGGLHHAAAALGVPGVVVFGGFTPVELTGYPLHRNLGVSLDQACGLRTPCPHCAAEMAKISPEQVLRELSDVLQRN